MLVSAKAGDGVNNLFTTLVNKYLDPSFQEQIGEDTQKNEGKVKITKQTETKPKKRSFCQIFSLFRS